MVSWSKLFRRLEANLPEGFWLTSCRGPDRRCVSENHLDGGSDHGALADADEIRHCLSGGLQRSDALVPLGVSMTLMVTALALVLFIRLLQTDQETGQANRFPE